MKYFRKLLYVFLLSVIMVSCKSKNLSPSKEVISQLNLKRGDVISCGPPDAQFGTVDFEMTCDEKAKKDFNLAIELLHSFEYDESEKVFAKIIDETPECAMAYWGVAMCNFHPLWNPPTEAELEKGAKAIAIAKSITQNQQENPIILMPLDYFIKTGIKKTIIPDVSILKKQWSNYIIKYPDDHEAAIFYAFRIRCGSRPHR